MGSDTDFEELLSAATGQEVRVGAPKRSLLAGALWALASLPLVSMILLGTMALRVRVADGAWPLRNQPDPKELGFHNTVTVLAVVGSFVAVILVPVVALLARALGRRRLPVGPPVLAILGFVLVLLVIRADLGGLGSWLAD